jgi:hypothetical protein
MSIPVTCACGHTLRIKEEYAGRKVRCSSCQAVLLVPDPEAAEPAEEVMEVQPVDSPADDQDVDQGIQAERTQRGAMSSQPPAERTPWRPLEDEEVPRRRRPVRRRPGPPVAFERGWFGNVNTGVGGGLLMMLIAVIWFFGGLMVGIIFFYPPVLFIIGIVAVIAGFTRR